MKASRRNANPKRRDGNVYRAFLRLDAAHRRRVALQILSHERVLADLYDHFLIDKALTEPGRSISWDIYCGKVKPSAP